MMTSTSPNKASSRLMWVLVVATAIASVQSQEVGNEFCKTAIEKAICTSQVKGATNLHDAIKNAIESTLQLNAELQKILPDVYTNFNALSKIPKETSISTCNENFGSFEEKLKEALEALDQNDIGTIMARVADCKWSDCQEAFENSGLEFPPTNPPKFSEITSQMFQYIDNIMAVAQQTI